ncbi:MAG: trypsin-like peptidase domain-containing protein [Saprospiraceae bacterium]
MKVFKFLPHLIVSIISSAVAITAYHFLVSPDIKMIENKIKSHEMSFDEFLYSGKVKNNHPAYNVGNFVKAAADSREAVVYILSYEKLEKKAYVKGFKREKGSGVIVHQDGYIVTNYHVVDKASHIEITLNNKKEYLAEVVGTDPTTDLALLKIEANNLPILVFGDSDGISVGEWVLAVGNPFGLQSTVTAGIISAKARNIDLTAFSNNIESLIQSDVAINPGSSGGALISETGQLMGINTAIISASGNYEGISFAIPSNVVRKVVFDLKQFGAVQRAKMGITLRDVDANLAEMLEMDEVKGVFVVAASFSGAAQAAGIKRGDVIVAINKKQVNTTPEFTEKLNEFRPGDRIEIEYQRNQKTFKTKVLLKNHLNTTDFVAIKNSPKLREIGIEVRNMNSIEKDRTNAQGIYVVSVSKGSTAQKSNMEPGYIITEINGQRIHSDQQFLKIIGKSKGGLSLNGFYERYPGEFPYELKVD